MLKGIWCKAGVTVGLVAMVGLLIAGCGGGSSGANQSEIAQAERHARQEKTEKEKERRLERKLQTLERETEKPKSAVRKRPDNNRRRVKTFTSFRRSNHRPRSPRLHLGPIAATG